MDITHTETTQESQTRDPELFYVTYVMDDQEQSISLTEYLISHGVEAYSSSSSEVVVPLTNPLRVHYVYQLKRSWRDYWLHHMSSLFDLPVYIKRD